MIYLFVKHLFARAELRITPDLKSQENQEIKGMSIYKTTKRLRPRQCILYRPTYIKYSTKQNNISVDRFHGDSETLCKIAMVLVPY